MNDLKMGFKQSMMKRLQHYDMYPVKATPPPPTTTTNTTPFPMDTTTTNTSPALQVTDFSINRILSEPKPSRSPRRVSPKIVPTNTNSSLILDLSKSATSHTADMGFAATSGTANAQGYAPNYYGLPPDILAVAAAANATKFYAQFFPHIFPAYTQSQPYSQKRYFAPYIVNTHGAANSTTAPTTTTTTARVPPATTLPPPHRIATHELSPTALTVAGKMACPRMDCMDCLDYYKQYSYKGQRFSSSSPMSVGTVSSGYSSAKSKSSTSEILLNASTISLTAVTNLNITAKSSSGGVAVGSALGASNGLGIIGQEEISYKCRICDKVFGCSQTLQAHEKTHKSPRYECTDCGKGFSQLRNYKYHLSVHRGTKEFAAECPECGKTFNDKGYLSSHMKIHRNKKEYECPYCPKSFNQRVAFNMHVRIHTGVKPHKCSECGKRFSRKMLLKQHMRTHSGEKPYQCSVCGKSFADRSNMTLHHRLHSGIKPFSCPICPKAFTKKHHLKTHLNYHTGCKPYVCPHPNCNQAFTQSSNMRTHAKKCQFRPIQLQFPAVSSSATPPNASPLISTTPTTTATTTVDLSRMSSSSLVSTSSAASSTMAMQKIQNSMAFGIRMLTGHASTSTSTATSVSHATTFQSTVFPNPLQQQQQLLSTMRPF